MSRFVLDASAVLALVLREGLNQVDSFFATLDDNDELLGPLLLFPECTSVIHEQVGKGRLTAAEAPGYLEDILRLNIRVTDDPGQFRGAIEFAGRLGHAKAYDAQYISAAVNENAELVTVDSGMRQAAINVKHAVRFLR